MATDLEPVPTAGATTPTPTGTTGAMTDARQRLLVWLAFAVAAVVAAALLLHLGRGLTWFFDEWDWVQARRTGSLDDLLRNHNGHLIALPLLAYKATWSWFGLGGYTELRVLTVLLHVATAAVLLVWLLRRLRPELALALVVVVLFLGSAWQDLLWPSQLQYLGSMFGGIAALVFLDRRDRTGDVLAAIALAVALASSGVGLPFVGAVGLILVLRRSTWRRLWVPLAPLALYGVWYLQYGESQAKSDNLHLVADYVEQAGASAVGALLGRGIDVGHVVAGALVALVVVTVAVRRRISPELAGVLALPFLFWALTALSRAQAGEPGASRYLYPGAIFVVLVLGQLVDDAAWPRTAKTRLVSIVIAGVLVVVSLAGNVPDLRDGAAGLRDATTAVRAELAAVELARSHVDAGYRPDLVRAPQVFAGPYLRAVDDLGSPADSLSELRRQSEPTRAMADTVLLGALRARVAPGAAEATTPTRSSPQPTTVEGTVSAGPGACLTVVPTGGPAAVEFRGDAPKITVTAVGEGGVDVAARNLADGFEGGAVGRVLRGQTRHLSLPSVRSGPWTVRLSSTGSFAVC